MDIIIENLQTKIPLNTAQARKIIQKIINEERLLVTQLSCNFVSRQRIKQLNKRFLKREYATDVLAFDFSDQWSVVSGQKKAKSNQPLTTEHLPLTTRISGDIIISVDAAVAQAQEYGTSIAYELTLYIVHGLLHLLGYDDHAPKDIQKMRRKEIQVMKYLTKLTPRIVPS